GSGEYLRILDGRLDLERVRVHAPIALNDMQLVGVWRDTTFRRHPGVVGEVLRIDDEHVAVPAADRITAIRRGLIVTMRTSVVRNQTVAGVGLGQLEDHLW